MAYKLVTYDSGRGARAGAVIGETIVDIADATGNVAYSDMTTILEDWPSASGVLSRIDGSNGSSVAFDASRLKAPLRAGTIYCAGANYGDHVAEMAAKEQRPVDPDPHTVGLKPWHFIKSAHAVVGPGAVVAIPPASKKMDWEIELAAVIGIKAKNVSEGDALAYVAGYTIANDLSARDLSWRPPTPKDSPFYADWVGQKNFDGACPLGPWIVPASDIADPQNLGIRLSVNGVTKQDSNTSRMLFTLAEQIAQLSLRITLYPGDVVLTGTPAGVGAGRGEFLKAGDTLDLWCESIGTLTHTMG
jgi:2-keto-4-pentenoate hydratase/2-oxohepta-3-ene-1,7-dioic acid hydratase in catechol pathway